MSPSNQTAMQAKNVDDVEFEEVVKMEKGEAGRASSAKAEAGASHRMLLGLLFGGWFAFTVCYNISNKKTLAMANVKWSLAWFQFFVGVPYVLFMWFTGIRKAPRLSGSELIKLTPLAVFHCITHIAAVLAMASGGVSFTHIVKAGEPITTAILAAILTGQVYHWQVYASLFPVVVGIGITSCHQVEFFMSALIGALCSTLGSSMRGIYSKKIMVKPIGENLNPANLYGVLTIMSCLMFLPFWMYFEAFELPSLLATAAETNSITTIYSLALTSGVCYYLYNEVAFKTLHHVAPITHSVANTMKRIFIIAAAAIFLNGDIKGWAWVGAGLAIGGVFLYSIVKQKFD